METNFKPLPKIELFNIDLLKKAVSESTRFYIVNSTDFNRVYNQKKKSGSLNVKREDWSADRIAYHLNYYNVTDLVICEVGTRQYVVTAQLFLLLHGNNLQAKITLENN